MGNLRYVGSTPPGSDDAVVARKYVTDQLALKAPIDNPTFTGTVITPAIRITGGSPAVGMVLRASNTNGTAAWSINQAIYTDTAANWASLYAASALALGIAAYESDTGKMKVGNGSSNWAALPYVGLQIGTSATTAMAGNKTAADLGGLQLGSTGTTAAAGNHTHTASAVGAVANASGQTLTLWKGTQAQYDALGTWSSNTVYIVSA